jgi:hypothetical protein
MGDARGIYDQWMYFVWGGSRSPFATLHCWVAQWCLYPHYQKLVVFKFQHHIIILKMDNRLMGTHLGIQKKVMLVFFFI